MNNTFIPLQNSINKKWFLVDGTETGTTEIAKIYDAIGFDPDTRTYIEGYEQKPIKWGTEKLYRRHSGRPGGLKVETLEQVRRRLPHRILEKSVKGMLPKGPLGRQLYTKLKVYSGSTHSHQAQKPELINI